MLATTITAGGVAILATAAATLISSVGAVVIGLRNRTTVTEVHSIVNGRTDNLIARTVQLEEALAAMGHEVPPDPNIALGGA